MAAYRLDILQDCGAYPRIGVLLPSLTTLMAPGVYTFDRLEVRSRVRAHHHHADRARTAAPADRRPPAVLERAVDLFAAEIGMDPAEVRRRNMLPPFARAAHHRHRRACTTSATIRGALERALQAAGYDDLRAEQRRRREAGDVVALGIGLAVYVEITGGGDESGPAERERHGRGPPGRLGDDPHRHVAARAGSRHGVGDVRQRGARHPDREDHREVGRHRSDPAGRRHRRIAQPATGRRRGSRGRPRPRGGRQAPGVGRAGGGRHRPRRRHRPGRHRRGRRAGQLRQLRRPGRRGTSHGSRGVHRARARPSRSARTLRWWTSTPNPARSSCSDWSPSTTPEGSSTR